MRKIISFVILAAVFFLYACANNKPKSEDNRNLTVDLSEKKGDVDSIALTTLLANVLQWNDSIKIPDFDVVADNDSVYTGINRAKLEMKISEMEKTNFFSDTFIDNYRDIGEQIDNGLKNNKIKYYIGDLPPYGTDENPWCGCQDYSEDDIKFLKVKDLILKDSYAELKWSLDKQIYHLVTAKLENGVWKISNMEGFSKDSWVW